MTKKLVLFVMILGLILLWSTVRAEGDTSSTFIMGVGSVLAAQNQEVEDITFTTQLNAIRLLPWVPWYIAGMAQYDRREMAGEDEVDINARLVAFFSDPNGPEQNGSWVGFLTVGGVEFWDNDGDGETRTIRTNTGGSIGVIGPIIGINWVLEFGVKWMPNSAGENKPFWAVGVGFFGIPKSPIKF